MFALLGMLLYVNISIVYLLLRKNYYRHWDD